MAAVDDLDESIAHYYGLLGVRASDCIYTKGLPEAVTGCAWRVSVVTSDIIQLFLALARAKEYRGYVSLLRGGGVPIMLDNGRHTKITWCHVT